MTYRAEVEPLAFYEAILEVTFDAVPGPPNAPPPLRLTVDRDLDYNGEEITGRLEPYGGNEANGASYLLRRVLRSDDKGHLSFAVLLDRDRMKENASVSELHARLVPANDRHGFHQVVSDDGSIRLLYRQPSLTDADPLWRAAQTLAEGLSHCRAHLRWLVGDQEPYGVRNDFVLTEAFPYFGLAGDPIYICHDDAWEDLATLASGGMTASAPVFINYVHELSHTFDGVGRSAIRGDWNFDPEFMATLKKVYALYAASESLPLAKASYEYMLAQLAAHDTLPNGVYSSYGLAHRLLREAQDLDLDVWPALAQTFRSLRGTLTPGETPRDRFDRFWQALNRSLGLKLEDHFPGRAWSTIASIYAVP